MSKLKQIEEQHIHYLPNATKPTYKNKINVYRKFRKSIGAFLEYSWELSGSARLYKADVILISGEEKHTHHPIKALYIGHYDNYKFIFSKMCSKTKLLEKYTKINSICLKKWIGKYGSSVDIIVLDVELFYCKILPQSGFIRIPHWIRQKYVIPETWEKVLNSFRKNTKKTDLRKIRKYNFSYRITKSDKDFKYFYHKMYKPYLQNRFDDIAIIEPRLKFMRQCRKGELMQIIREDQVVAAVLLHNSEGRLGYVWVGVPDAIDAEMFKGAFSALYYFTILYGYNYGCHEIDFLGTRPLLNDGLFRYKRKWGTYVQDSPVPRGDILLKPLRFNRAVMSFFAHNYFIVRDEVNLVGKILFQDKKMTQNDLERITKLYHTKGLQSLKIYSMLGFDATAKFFQKNNDNILNLYDLSDSPDPASFFSNL